MQTIPQNVLTKREIFALSCLQGLLATIDLSFLDASGELEYTMNRLLIQKAILLADQLTTSLKENPISKQCYDSIKDRLIIARLEAGLTRSQLAEKANLTLGDIYCLESLSVRSLSFLMCEPEEFYYLKERLEKVANYLNIPIETL